MLVIQVGQHPPSNADNQKDSTTRDASIKSTNQMQPSKGDSAQESKASVEGEQESPPTETKDDSKAVGVAQSESWVVVPSHDDPSQSQVKQAWGDDRTSSESQHITPSEEKPALEQANTSPIQVQDIEEEGTIPKVSESTPSNTVEVFSTPTAPSPQVSVHIIPLHALKHHCFSQAGLLMNQRNRARNIPHHH